MKRAHEDDKTRQLAEELGYIPVVPPKKNRRKPRLYDQVFYRQRKEVERFFRRMIIDTLR